MQQFAKNLEKISKTEKFPNGLFDANVGNVEQGDNCKCGKCLSQQNSNSLQIF